MSQHTHRRAAVLAVALTALVVTGLFLGAMLRSCVHELRQQRSRQHQWQAQWLARSGMERAQTRLAAEPAYVGETWKPISGASAAEITIRVEKDEPAGLRWIVVRANYPAESPLAARFELSRDIATSKSD